LTRCLLCEGICPECGGYVGEPAGRPGWILCAMCHATFRHEDRHDAQRADA
jgi:hypothetical protein